MATIPEPLIQKEKTGGRWILKFNGLEAFFAGVYPDVAKLDGVQGDRSRADKADFRPRMEFLASNANNFFRHWVTFYPLFANGLLKDPPPEISNFRPKPDCTQIDPSRSITSGGEPWPKRYSPFLYLDDEGKSDLSRYNEDFFLRLRRMIEAALEFGILVQLTIFDRSGLSLEDCGRWPYSPWSARNNINAVINTAENNTESGVDKFYKRDLPGVIRVPRIHPIRPGDDDGGGGDPDDYVERPTTLGALQDKYARKVVGDTVKYPNVVYEIMNEPFGGGQAGDVPARVKWNDTMLGVINEITQRKRLIFYNELIRGDIAAWRKSTTTANYSKLDGVIFHGNAKTFEPDNLGQGILGELVIQVSTDTHNSVEREDPGYNTATTTHAFAKHMMFQSEAGDRAAPGILDSETPPTQLKLPPLIGKWLKLPDPRTTDNFPHLLHVQNPDGTVIDLNQDTDAITFAGRAVAVTPKTVLFRKDPAKGMRIGPATLFSYEFVAAEPPEPRTPGGLRQITLEFARNNNTQVFRKLNEHDLLYPFFFKWERTSVTPASTVLPYFAFYYPDKTLITRRVSDLVVNNRAKVTSITATQISIHSETMSSDSVWNYRFTNDRQQMTLEKPDHSVVQVFIRRV